MTDRQRVLFLCTHNSARSQMAEAMLRAWAGERYEVHSAGTVATTVNPLAVAVMDELGIDLREQESKALERFLSEPFDLVVTVCDEARDSCPVFPGARRREHWSFEDPSAATGTEEERLVVFRRVRDGLADRVRALAASG